MTAGATVNLTPEQSKYLVALVPGAAAVCTDGMDYPVLARIPGGAARETGIPALAAPPTGIIAPRSVEAIVGVAQAHATLALAAATAMAGDFGSRAEADAWRQAAGTRTAN